MDDELLKTGEVPQETGGEAAQPAPDYRAKALGYLGGKNPDKQYGEEDDLMADLVEAAEADASEIGRINEVNQKLVDLFESEPVLFNIIQDALEGAPGHVAIARNISPEDLEAANADDGDWSENLKQRPSRMEERRNRRSEMEANIQASMEVADKFAESKGMTPQETTDFLEKVDNALADVYKGKVTPDFLEQMWKALNYENHMEEARGLGEAKGRNEKIVTEDKRKKGDNLPKIASSGATPVAEAAPKKLSYIDRLNGVKG